MSDLSDNDADGDLVADGLKRATYTPVPLGPEERQVHAGLMRVAPAAAWMFLDAAAMVAAIPRRPTTPMLVGHLVREVESTLTAMLDPLGGRRDPEEKDGEAAKRLRIIEALGLTDEEPWLIAIGRRGPDLKPHLWAHHSSPDRLRAADDEFDKFWQLHLAAFAALLDLFERRAAPLLDQIESIASGVGTLQKKAKALAQQVPRDYVSMKVLFDVCSGSDWLHWLRKAGFFASPPTGEADPETGAVRFYGWPAGDYLIRMAAEPSAEDEVAEILKNLAPTENPYVYRQLVDAALVLPPPKTVDLVPQVRAALALGSRTPSAIEIAKVVARLSDAGYGDDALSIASLLFVVSRQESGVGSTATSPYGDWAFAQACKAAFPCLIKAAPLRVAVFVFDLLDVAVAAGLGSSRSDWDMSEYWRSAIDDTNPEREDPRNALVDAARDSISAAVGSGEVSLADAVRLLEQRDRLVYRRLALHLIATHASDDLVLAESRALRSDFVEDTHAQYERARLLAAVLPLVSATVRRAYLVRVSNGPDQSELSDLDARYVAAKNRGPTATETADYIRHWKVQRLFPVQSALSAQARREYEALVAEEPKPPSWGDYAVFQSGTFWGDEAPIEPADLAAMTTAATADYLRAWVPPEDTFMGPTVRGLCNQLQRAVEDDPSKYARGINDFLDLRQEYVDAVIRALEQAVRKDVVFPWDPVVRFLATCTAEHRYESAGTERGEGDQTLAATASLLNSGFGSVTNPIPVELFDVAWSALRPAFADPNPTSEYEKTYGGTNMDPFMLSINTVRGEATHALLSMLIAKGRAIGEFDQPLKSRHGVTRWPDLRRMLESRLDPATEPSLAVRAAIGSRLDVLAILDPSWLENVWAALLPEADPERREVVFDAYLTMGMIRVPIVDTFLGEYLFRVRRLGEAEPVVVWDRHEPEAALAHHIVVLYLCGVIELDHELVRTLYSTPNQGYWADATTHVTRIIDARRQAGEDIESAVIERATKLWESRIDEAERGQSRGAIEEHRPELEHFGYWLITGAFEPEWWLGQLQRVLRLVHWAEPDSLVMKKIAGVAHTSALYAVESATEMLQHDSHGYIASAFRDEFTTIVEAALKSADASVVASGHDLANRLVAKGEAEFRGLAGSGQR